MKAVIHIHTNVSRCASNSFAQLIDECKKHNISSIAVTDHNTIQGALELQKIAPKWLNIIVGEEISTVDGEVIGLFLKNEINGKGRRLKDVIKDIKSQNGLTMIPHPFDKIRTEAVQDQELVKELASEIDFFEVFNARSLFAANKNAQEFFEQGGFQNMVACFGADAHFPSEVSNAIIEMDDFNDAISFKSSYKNSKVLTKKSAGPLPLVISKLKKMTSKK